MGEGLGGVFFKKSFTRRPCLASFLIRGFFFLA